MKLRSRNRKEETRKWRKWNKHEREKIKKKGKMKE
jgi:hypothetical protein